MTDVQYAPLKLFESIFRLKVVKPLNKISLFPLFNNSFIELQLTYPTVYLFKVKYSVIFSIFTELYNLILILERFHYLKRNSIFFNIHFLPNPYLIYLINLFSTSIALPFWIFHSYKPIQYVVFCVWCLSPDMKFHNVCKIQWLHNIPLCGFGTFYVSIHQLVDIWVVFALWPSTSFKSQFS